MDLKTIPGIRETVLADVQVPLLLRAVVRLDEIVTEMRHNNVYLPDPTTEESLKEELSITLITLFAIETRVRDIANACGLKLGAASSIGLASRLRSSALWNRARRFGTLPRRGAITSWCWSCGEPSKPSHHLIVTSREVTLSWGGWQAVSY